MARDVSGENTSRRAEIGGGVTKNRALRVGPNRFSKLSSPKGPLLILTRKGLVFGSYQEGKVASHLITFPFLSHLLDAAVMEGTSTKKGHKGSPSLQLSGKWE